MKLSMHSINLSIDVVHFSVVSYYAAEISYLLLLSSIFYICLKLPFFNRPQLS